MIRFERTRLVLGGLSVRWYGLMIALGIALGVLCASLREKRLGLPKDTALDLAVAGVPAAIVGARAYFVLFSLDAYRDGPWWRVFAVWEGGLAVYGGILGGLLAGLCYAKAKGLPFLKLADLAAPCFAIGQAVGRWGNFLNMEAYGGAVGPQALRFFPVAVRIGTEWHYATFFYESAWCALTAAVLLWLEKRGRLRRTGDGFFTYVLMYAAERAFVEGLRTDSLWLGPLRVSQALSLLAMLAVGCLWAAHSRDKRRWAGPALALAAAVTGAAGLQLWFALGLLAALAVTMAGEFRGRGPRTNGKTGVENL